MGLLLGSAGDAITGLRYRITLVQREPGRPGGERILAIYDVARINLDEPMIQTQFVSQPKVYMGAVYAKVKLLSGDGTAIHTMAITLNARRGM